MKKEFSSSWIRSKQPRKQRKYVKKAPLHILGGMLKSVLSKDLRKKYSKKNLRLKKGDSVKIMRGQFKGKTGKVDKIWLRRQRVNVDCAIITKKDGSKVFYPIHPSNLKLTELHLEDKKRKKVLERK